MLQQIDNLAAACAVKRQLGGSLSSTGKCMPLSLVKSAMPRAAGKGSCAIDVVERTMPTQFTIIIISNQCTEHEPQEL